MVEPIKIQIALADLLDVINAHSNPAIATAILDGSYVNPITHLDEQLPRYHKNYYIKNDDDKKAGQYPGGKGIDHALLERKADVHKAVAEYRIGRYHAI